MGIEKVMYEHMKEADAKEGHFKMEKSFGDDKVVMVVSVYRGIQPAHEALVTANEAVEELYHWAKENQKADVIEKLNELVDLASMVSE